MPNNDSAMRPTPLLVGAVAVFLGLLLSREVPQEGGLPAFLSNLEKNIYVELVFDDQGGRVYQINDGSTHCDVIKLTDSTEVSHFEDCRIPLVSGEKIFLRKKARKFEVLERGWMAAGQRIALSIPLHPDRMNYNDWQILPGIGERLAEKIEADRQKNGEFGTLEQLVRVKGLGQKRVMSWQEVFQDM
jgi:competence protein ComEA